MTLLPSRLARILLAALALSALSACSKKEAPAEKEKPKGEEKQNENIVALTPGNLEHVKIETEEAKLGDLETTLKAAGRVGENLNKTAKVVSTLEGRLTKLKGR